MIHYFKCKFFTLTACLAFAGHKISKFIKTDISERQRRIPIVQVFINRFTFFQTCYSTVLPVNRAYVRHNTLQCFMTAHKRLIAKLQTFVKQFPKLFFIALSHKSDLRKIYTYNTLIKSSLPLVLTVFVFPR